MFDHNGKDHVSTVYRSLPSLSSVGVKSTEDELATLNTVTSLFFLTNGVIRIMTNFEVCLSIL